MILLIASASSNPLTDVHREGTWLGRERAPKELPKEWAPEAAVEDVEEDGPGEEEGHRPHRQTPEQPRSTRVQSHLAPVTPSQSHRW